MWQGGTSRNNEDSKFSGIAVRSRKQIMATVGSLLIFRVRKRIPLPNMEQQALQVTAENCWVGHKHFLCFGGGRGQGWHKQSTNMFPSNQGTGLICCKNACPDREHSVWLVVGSEYSASPTCAVVGQKYRVLTKQYFIKWSICCNFMQTQQLMQGGRIPLPAQSSGLCCQSCGNREHFGKAARPSYTGEKSFCSGTSSSSGSQPFSWAGLWTIQCSTSVTRLLVLNIRAGLQLEA